MLRRLQNRFGTRNGAVRFNQLSGRIHSPADFAGIAILVFGVALGALALDITIRQEHALDGVIELLDGSGFD